MDLIDIIAQQLPHNGLFHFAAQSIVTAPALSSFAACSSSNMKLKLMQRVPRWLQLPYGQQMVAC